MIRKKLIKLGGSYAIVLDKSLLLMLGIKPETTLNVTTDNYRIMIESSENRRKRLASDEYLNSLMSQQGVLKLLNREGLKVAAKKK